MALRGQSRPTPSSFQVWHCFELTLASISADEAQVSSLPSNVRPLQQHEPARQAPARQDGHHAQVHYLLQVQQSCSGQCDQIWRNFATFTSLQVFGQFLSVYFLFGNMLSLLWQICDIIGLNIQCCK